MLHWVIATLATVLVASNECVVSIALLYSQYRKWLTEYRRATRNGDLNNNIAEHHIQTNHRIDWDSAECVTYSTNYYQRIVVESWFTNLEHTPLNRCLQLPAPYKRLVDDINNRQTTDWPTTTHGSKRSNHCLQETNNRPTNFTNNTHTYIRLTKDGSKRTNHCVQSSQPMTTRLNWQSTNNITTSLTNHINDQSIYTTNWRYTNHLTLKMTSAQVVETSVNVTLNSPSQDYPHPDDRTPLSYDILAMLVRVMRISVGMGMGTKMNMKVSMRMALGKG